MLLLVLRLEGDDSSHSLLSSTNTYHGDVFEFVRNSALDARNYFSTTQAPLSLNEFGATFSGPLFPNQKNPKTFFFADYSGQRLNQGISNGLLSVPAYNVTTVGGVPGYDFSAYKTTPGTANIKNPATKAPYANNFIPLNDPNINATGANVLNFYQKYATPNVVGATTGNFLFVPTKTDTENAFDVKVDHRACRRQIRTGQLLLSAGVRWKIASKNSSVCLLTG
jgi:hypothetical protein